MEITLFGIPNCDQVKKARNWLAAQGIAYVFHDFKKAGIHDADIRTWLDDVPMDVLINRKGTTWRALSDTRKAEIIDQASAISLMLEAPSVVKRPVLMVAGRTHVGFSDDIYQQIFKK